MGVVFDFRLKDFALQYIDPLRSTSKRIVLASTYPLLQSSEYDHVSATCSLMAQCIIQESCTIPGSLVIDSPSLYSLVRKNATLVRGGALVLDMRQSVRSYRELVLTKYGANASDDLRRTADFLDELCPSVLHFDPDKSSSLYRSQMSQFLRTLHDSTSSSIEKIALDNVLRQLENSSGLLTYNEAKSFTTNIRRIDDKISAAAKFFYCACGASTLNATVEVPAQLYDMITIGETAPQLDPSVASDETDLSIAHHAILQHFAIERSALYRLTADDVMKLRSDGATQRAVSQLNSIISSVREDFAEDGRVPSSSLKELSAYRRDIADRVLTRSHAQAKRKSGSGALGDTLETGWEAADLFPYVKPALKGLTRLGRLLSRRSPKLRWLDATLGPIETYATRLQRTLSGHPVRPAP